MMRRGVAMVRVIGALAGLLLLSSCGTSVHDMLYYPPIDDRAGNVPPPVARETPPPVYTPPPVASQTPPPVYKPVPPPVYTPPSGARETPPPVYKPAPATVPA